MNASPSRRIRSVPCRALGASAAALVLVAFFVVSRVLAATVTVCGNGCDHTTIQAAVSAAAGGDTITVAAGTYSENVTGTAAGDPTGQSATVETSSGVLIVIGRTASAANGDPGARTITETVGNVIEINITSTLDGQPITELAEPITLTFQVSGTDLGSIPGATNDDLGIFYWDVALGQWVEVPSVYDPVTGQLVAHLDHLTVFAVMVIIPAEREVIETLRYYGVTDTYLAAGFKVYFDATGGLVRHGYPRLPETVERGLTVQWFQRGRLEWQPANPAAQRVQIGLVGLELLEFRGIYFPPEPLIGDPLSDAVRYFDVTGHYVSYGFLDYFDQHGGLAAFGYPISPEYVEEGRVVQYFQRARFQYNPELAGTPYLVQLGLIGDEDLMLTGRLGG